MTARALKLGTVGDLCARAGKGFMTKMVSRPSCRNLINLIIGTYVKSLKAPLPFTKTPSFFDDMSLEPLYLLSKDRLTLSFSNGGGLVLWV